MKVARVWSKISDKNNIQIAIMLLFLFMTSIFFIRNGLNIRVQRDSYMIFSLIFCGGLYIAMLDKFSGILIVYAAIVAVTKGIELPQATFIMAYMMMYIYCKNYHENRERMYDAFIFIAAANLIMQLTQAVGWHWLYPPVDGQIIYPGLMGNRNETSALYAITAAATLRKGRYPFIIINIAGLCMAVSMGGVLAFCVMINVWAFMDTKKIIIRGSVVALILAFILFFSSFIHAIDIEKRQKERFFVWEKTIKVAMLQKIGWGFGQYDKIMPLFTSWKHVPDATRAYVMSMIRDRQTFNQAVQNLTGNDANLLESNKMLPAVFAECHNEFVQWFFIGGWVGMVVMLVFLVSTLWAASKNIDRVPFYGIIASCVTAMTFFTWQIVTTAVITVIYLAWVKAPRSP